MLRVFVTSLALTIPSLPAWAEVLTCGWNIECRETENCADTDYRFSVYFHPKRISPDGFIAQARLEDGTSVTPGLYGMKGDRRMVISGDSYDGTETKTMIAPDGTARHVVLNGVDMTVIVYHGTCEETA